MENDEKEDLLLGIAESEEEEEDEDEDGEEAGEKEEIDYRIVGEKILDYVRNEGNLNSKSVKKRNLLILNCSLAILSSLSLIVVLPIYGKCSSLENLSAYSKLMSLSLANAISLGIIRAIGFLLKCDFHQSSPNHSVSLPDVFKIGFSLSVGSISVFWLIDENYVRCHLEDPLKGCSVVFSLFFYYLFSRNKMSIEKTFCAITIIVGVFVSIDFGLCDRFHCKGSYVVNEVVPKLHCLYIFLYLLSHGVWVLHFTLIEVCWTSFKDSNSSSNELSIVSNLFGNDNSQAEKLKNLIPPSLSVISLDDGNQDLTLKNEYSAKLKNNKKSFLNSKCQSNNIKFLNGKQLDNTPSNSVPCFSQLSVFDIKKFPVTSTPKNDVTGWQSWTSSCHYDVALWSHIICCLIIISLCWIETVPFLNNGKAKLLVDVINEVVESFRCHLGWKNNSGCSYLPAVMVIFSASYVTMILSCLELMKNVQSTVTVVAILMPALPMSSLFWSLFHMSENADDLLEFSPEISGEAVCAVLGLPIIGIGIVLLLKSHIREVKLVM